KRTRLVQKSARITSFAARAGRMVPSLNYVCPSATTTTRLVMTLASASLATWETDMSAPRWLTVSLFLLPLMLWQPLWAADSDEKSEPPRARRRSAEGEDSLLTGAAEAEDAPRQATGEDTFTPAVQISEDRSVSFPVDI